MNKVSEIRAALSVSQHELSRAMHVGQSTISQYENDGCDPSLDAAKRLIEFASGRGLRLTLDQVYALDEFVVAPK
ncbi:helix-turn-helix transcriptional regulator [Paraburkholderia sp. SIMBA_054]|uniref:helix-turn-helix transcriptional regulator n=1 Tax=Paraburkholderia sp. SIMBA_054 TaxID=3085795 RepID=UPI00397E1829